MLHQSVHFPEEQIEGCMIFGVLQVQKVPAKLVISLASETHSFDHEAINTTHHINHLIFGDSIWTLNPGYLKSVATKLNTNEKMEYIRSTEDQFFLSQDVNTTHEHYIEMVETHYQSYFSNLASVKLFKYTTNSGSFVENPEHRPAIRLNYDISPLVVVMESARKPLVKFLVSVCAIVGGVFTVLGLVDGLLIGTYKAVTKKLD